MRGAIRHKVAIALGCVLLALTAAPTATSTATATTTPKLYKTHFNLGLTYLDLGQYERAIEDFDEAIRLNPQSAIAYNNRGVAYERLGKTREAELDYTRRPKNLDTPPRLYCPQRQGHAGWWVGA